MEQTKHWTWTRRKLSGLPYIQPFAPSSMAVGPYDSWEEQAFAEDAASGLGGCVWPPRSYSCSFCQREFRSAQALGGHMNVHRRDRARLKQSPPVADPLENSHPHDNHHHHLLQYNPCPQTQICPLVRNPNPNRGVDVALSTPLPPSRPSFPSNPENCGDMVSPSYVSPSIIQKNSNHLSFSAPNLRTQIIPELKLGGVGLSLGMTSAKRERDSCHEQEKEEQEEEEGWNIDHGTGKRQRTAEGLHSFLDLKPSGHCLHLRIEAVEHDHGSIEEVDLELRLGGSAQAQGEL